MIAAIPSSMEYRLITCPETAHLELIQYEATPHGMLITSCSASGACPLTCPRTCAARFDRRDRMPRVLEVRSLLGL